MAPRRADRGARPQFASLGGGADRLVVRCSSADPRTQTLVRGGAGDDELEINCATADRIGAGPGDDVVYAGLGRDEVWGEEGNDVLIDEFSRVEDCEQGLPLLYPQYGPDTRCVQLGRQLFLDYEDQWLGGEGDDVVRGGEANDSVEGEEGDDRLFGGPAADVILGGDGTDYCDGGDFDDAFDTGECETAVGFDTWQRRPSPFPDCSSAADPTGYADCLSTRPHVRGISWSPSTLDLASSPGSTRLILGIYDPFPREPHLEIIHYRAEVESSTGFTATRQGSSCATYGPDVPTEWPTEYYCPIDFHFGGREYTSSWRVTGLTVVHIGGERSIYTARDLEERLGGPPPELQVNGLTDEVPPAAYDLSVEPATVDVSAGDGWVTFAYTASDWQTGIRGGDVGVSHRGVEVASPSSSTVVVENGSDAQLSETVMIPRGSPPGDYDITIRVEDGFGNEKVYGSGHPWHLDHPSTFEVTNTP